MFSWSRATDSQPLRTQITLTDTKRRWQKHRFEHCLAGLLVSNTSKWIKLSPIKYLTTFFPLWVFFILCHQFPGRKTKMRSAFGKYYTNINSVHMWRVTFKETGCIVLGIKSRMLNFSVFQRNVFKLNLLLEMKYSGEKKNKEKQKTRAPLQAWACSLPKLSLPN